MEKRSTINPASSKMPPSKSFGKITTPYGSVESLAVDSKHVASTSCTPNKRTPNKSGLTPIRPGKSPGTGMKHKSGLTPIRPGAHGRSKSPFCTKPRLKSGLLPIRPNHQAQAAVSDFENSSFYARRKSGLQPIRPVRTFLLDSSALASQKRSDDLTVSESKPFSFNVPKQGGNSNEPFRPSASRRKSGLLPVKKIVGLGSVAHDGQFNRMPNPTKAVSNIDSNPVFRSQTRFQRTKTVEATPSLQSIIEDGDSSGNFRSNISGIAPLDDTVEMSVVIRPRLGHNGSSRVPLPRSTLDPTHFNSSDSMISRIPKRVLNFTDEDFTVRTHANVLKDGSSKANTIEQPATSNRIPHPSEAVTLVNDHKAVSTGKEKAALLKRKKELEDVLMKTSAELKEIDEKLEIMQEDETVNEIENLTKLEIRDDSESDSPFAHVNSPLSAAPLELLTLDMSKRPENIYKVFRQSCSFLKTPQPSAFRKPNDAMRFTQQSKTIDGSPNASQRLQKQLADLFAE